MLRASTRAEPSPGARAGRASAQVIKSSWRGKCCREEDRQVRRLDVEEEKDKCWCPKDMETRLETRLENVGLMMFNGIHS